MQRLISLFVLCTRPEWALAVAFPTKSLVQAALGRWCANGMSATEADGAPSTWDVSAVTDMSFLFYTITSEWTSDCRKNFHEARHAATPATARAASGPPAPRAACLAADRVAARSRSDPGTSRRSRPFG